MDSITIPSSLTLTAEEIQSNVVPSGASIPSSSSSSSRTTSSSYFTTGSSSVVSSPRYPCIHHPLGQPGQWNPCCNCFFSSLPDSLLTSEILSYLTVPEKLVAASVSSRFNFLVENSPSLWKHIQVSCTPASGIGLQRLLQRKEDTIQSLVLRNLSNKIEDMNPSSTSLSIPSSVTFHNLHHLDLSGNKHLSPDQITTFILRHGSFLKRLTLDSVVTLTDQHLTSILQACTSLTHLSLNQCRGLTDTTFEALSTSLSRYTLISLRLNSCAGMTVQGLEKFLQASLRSTSENNYNPKGGYGNNVSSLFPVPSWDMINQLRVLEVRGLRNILSCSSFLLTLAHSSPYLRVLDISSTDPFGSSVSNSSSPTNLLSDSVLQTLTYRCTKIENLRIAGHHNVTDQGTAIAIETLPFLRKFDIRGCRSIGDATMDSIHRCNLPLQELRCGINTVNFTDDGLRTLLATENVQKHLQILDLYGCRKLTIEGFESSIGPWCNALQGTEVSPFVSPPLSSITVPKIYIGGIPLFRNYEKLSSGSVGMPTTNNSNCTDKTEKEYTARVASTIQILAH